jgi:serine/threonine protein kinase
MTLIDFLQIELKQLGFKVQFTTIPELWSWLRRVKLVHVPPNVLIQDDTRWSTPTGTDYSEFLEAMEGTYGKLYLASRQPASSSEAQYCFIKTCENHPTSLLVEGILQTMARCALEGRGHLGTIPKVLDICAHPTLGTVLALERIHNSKPFSDVLNTELKWNSPCIENDLFLFSLLAQLASHMAILTLDLGMNHRDLKGTNVLMIAPQPASAVHTTLASYEWSIKSNYRCIVIDFGFACIGKPTGESVLSAGEYLPEIDFCPKEGRDLFLLFASLWSITPFRASLTEKGRGLFTNWLRGTGTTDWSSWLKGPESDKMLSMYLLTNSSTFRSPTSESIQVLRDIASTYPELVQFQVLKRPSTPRPDGF